MEQFGGDLSAPPIELLAALRQVGTMDEYCNEFHVRAAHISGIPSHIQLGLFLNGLKEEIRVRFRPNDATDLRTAMRVARSIARELDFLHHDKHVIKSTGVKRWSTGFGLGWTPSPTSANANLSNPTLSRLPISFNSVEYLEDVEYSVILMD
ncbi:arginine--tRNA ligase, partial [Striga asiatica]